MYIERASKRNGGGFVADWTINDLVLTNMQTILTDALWNYPESIAHCVHCHLIQKPFICDWWIYHPDSFCGFVVNLWDDISLWLPHRECVKQLAWLMPNVLNHIYHLTIDDEKLNNQLDWVITSFADGIIVGHFLDIGSLVAVRNYSLSSDWSSPNTPF